MSNTHVQKVNKNKTKSFFHAIFFITESLQQQNIFIGNLFGNKCCDCYEGTLYTVNPRYNDIICSQRFAIKLNLLLYRILNEYIGMLERSCFILISS